ncbi:MAG TPA: CsgG/HfaB family protein [Candidatus Saccharimonadales bacterium]|nr:CsgG/HfaB family protein [Candidatus Saccharimonadales bacterium]
MRLRFGLLLSAAVALAVVALGAAVPRGGSARAADTPAAGQAWHGYIEKKPGDVTDIGENLDDINDKDWMYLKFSAYKGPRVRVAVMPVENKLQAASSSNLPTLQWPGQPVGYTVEYEGSVVPVGGLDGLITVGLQNCHRFTMIERSRLNAVLKEQDLATSGRVSQPSAAKTGKVLGAQYLVLAAVNEWTPNKSKAHGAVGGKVGDVLSAVGGGKKEAEVAMSFRLVDATTGEILEPAVTERATAGSWKLGAALGVLTGSGGVGGLAGVEENSPISYALQACINKAVYRIATALAQKPWAGAVMKVAPGKIYVNGGSAGGLEVGMEFTVLAKGEELVDPETGAVLGSETKEIGTIKLDQVEEKFSIGTITEGCKGVKVGDIVRLKP